jgi:alkylhydroperoxidase/carboxymuconolactone decarboxylase family protein YurZ
MGETGKLDDKEKALVALGAAMGGGCRTCADTLHPKVRKSATDVMREKAAALMGRRQDPNARVAAAFGTRLAELVKVAAATAANSAPNALVHIEQAKLAGATDAEIGTTLAIARTVRSKAQGFSDAEIQESGSEALAAEELQACPAPVPEGAEQAGETSCCSTDETSCC